MNNAKTDILRSTRLFSSLTDEELLQVSGMMNIREFARNAVVLREEDTNAYMYVILAGKVKVVQSTEDGKEIILAIHSAKEFFGEVSMIDGKTAPATVVAIEGSLIAIISRNDFHTLLSSHSKLSLQLLQVLCARFRDCWEHVQLLNRKTASQRIKLLFLRLSHANGEETPDGVILRIKLTHQDIAGMSGLTRETVTKVLDQLKRDGDISLIKNRVIRLNPGFLVEDSAD